MDEKTVEKVGETIRSIAEDEAIKIDELMIFGSRARNDYTEDSDVDVVLVSEDFRNVKWYERGMKFQRDWDYGNLPDPEIICLTPEEFDERRKKLGDIVKRAVQEGIEI
ncbi:MAG: nucleotidyltransferase domain-containing protein [Candidatus Nanohaloarchaea archaeon]